MFASLCVRPSRAEMGPLSYVASKFQLLGPIDLDTLNVRATTIDWLTLLKPGKLPRGGTGLDCKNRIVQRLVKPSRLDNADRFQIVLKQKIVVIGMSRFEVRIAHTYPIEDRVKQGERWKIREVGARNSSSV